MQLEKTIMEICCWEESGLQFGFHFLPGSDFAFSISGSLSTKVSPPKGRISSKPKCN